MSGKHTRNNTAYLIRKLLHENQVIIVMQALEAGLCSLYAARATNLLIRVEPMQRRIPVKGGRLLRYFRRVVKTLQRRGVSPII